MKNRNFKNNFKDKNKSTVFRQKNTNKPNEDEEIKRLESLYDSIDPSSIKEFSDFPLSWKTLKGLKDSNYKTPTDIQREAIGFGLQKRDILGAAVTGSGKTLAFLIPVLENLFLKKFTRIDGVGALIISPTRELAYQIFETLKKVGKYHDFSAGLIIGGKNLQMEWNRVHQCNIIICTPGRLLQHMDKNPLFDGTSIQVLVLDEADRCLDMGFEQTMNGIIENLPVDRQTLLFSATQTKSIKDLARLSLKNPIYVAPHEQQIVTPESLQQNYVVVNLEDKITMLWSFIKNHLKQKCIVFLSSCKQVKYIYEIFCKLRPGISLLALYGTLNQDRRVAIYEDFCRKNNVVLFATDIASRGLDFPVVNWVIQLDCPEDVTQYIHRAGRTARHNAHGESLLVLLPSEEKAMVEEMQAKKISINQIHIDPKKLFSPKAKMEAFLAQSKELKESAQRAFVAYVKSVILMKNKNIFQVDEINLDAFARSLGLVVTPRVRFLDRLRKRQGLTGKHSEGNDDDDDKDIESESDTKETLPEKDDDLNFNSIYFNESDEDEDNLLKVKRLDHAIAEELETDEILSNDKGQKKEKVLTKAALAKRVLKKKIVPNKKVTFNEDGEEVGDPTKQLQSQLAKEYINRDEGGIDLEMAKKVLQEEDKFDKARFKQLVKAKHKEKKKKSKQKTKNEMDSDQEMDVFVSDEDDDGGDDVDLSWLPDPDRIYGTSKSDNDESDSESDNIHKPPEKFESTKPNKKRLKDLETYSEPSSEEEEEEGERVMEPLSKKAKKIASKLSINEAEEIAMQLLGNC